MPVYDYHCKKCQKLMEALIPLAKCDDPVKCPHCGKVMKKMIGAPVIMDIFHMDNNRMPSG